MSHTETEKFPSLPQGKGLKPPTLARRLKELGLVAFSLFIACTPDGRFAIDATRNSPYLANENLLTDPASIERLKHEKEIEKKYEIELITMQQAFELMNKEYNPLDSSVIPLNPPVRWSINELEMYDELFSYLPPTFLEPINGKKLKIFRTSLASTSCKCGGEFFVNFGIVNVAQTDSRERAFSALVHEGVHRLDLSTNGSLQTKVKKIMGNRLQELHTEEGFIKEYTVTNLQTDTILSLASTGTPNIREPLTSPDNHRNMVEGVAKLAQMYILGYEEFMSSLGPILDGTGTSVKQVDQTISPAENFPKTKEVYDLYKKQVFGGKEFDLGTRELIRIGAEAGLKIADDYLNLRKMLVNIEQDYGIKIKAETNTIYPGGIGEKKLRGILEAFPRNFYSANDSGELTIYFKQGRQEGIEFSVSESQDVIILPIETFFLNQSQTVITGRSSQTYLNPVDGIANNLTKRRDAATGYRTRDNIMAILGGENFLNSPESLFPDLNRIRGPLDPYAGEVWSTIYSGDPSHQRSVRSSAEIVGRLGVLYVKGRKELNESLKPFFGLVETAAIYGEMQELFEGIEFTGLDQGVPVRLSPLNE